MRLDLSVGGRCDTLQFMYSLADECDGASGASWMNTIPRLHSTVILLDVVMTM